MWYLFLKYAESLLYNVDAIETHIYYIILAYELDFLYAVNS